MHCIKVLDCKQQKPTIANFDYKGVLWHIWQMERRLEN